MTVSTNPRKTGKPAGLTSMGVFAPGVLTNNQVIVRLVTTQAYRLMAGLSTSKAASNAAATAAVAVKIQKNGADVGTVNWAIGATVATFTLAATTAFAVGDVLSLVGPASADATLADIAFSLMGVVD